MGEIFTLISTGLPYEVLIKKGGGQAPSRRGSVMKLLGDASLLPPGMHLQGDKVPATAKQQMF